MFTLRLTTTHLVIKEPSLFGFRTLTSFKSAAKFSSRCFMSISNCGLISSPSYRCSLRWLIASRSLCRKIKNEGNVFTSLTVPKGASTFPKVGSISSLVAWYWTPSLNLFTTPWMSTLKFPENKYYLNFFIFGSILNRKYKYFSFQKKMIFHSGFYRLREYERTIFDIRKGFFH